VPSKKQEVMIKMFWWKWCRPAVWRISDSEKMLWWWRVWVTCYHKCYITNTVTRNPTFTTSRHCKE